MSDEGVVYQTTPLGETYVHPTAEPYFTRDDAITTKGVIGWTKQKLSGDSYLIRFNACYGYPEKKSAVLPTPGPQKIHKPKVVYNSYKFERKKIFGVEWISHAGDQEIELHDLEFLNILRNRIAGKERSAATKQNLQLYARRLTDPFDLISKNEKRCFKIPVELVQWYVECAFYYDIKQEISAMIQNRRINRNQVSLHTKLLEDLHHGESTVLDTLNDVTDVLVQTVERAANPIVNAVTEQTIGLIDDYKSHVAYGKSEEAMTAKKKALVSLDERKIAHRLYGWWNDPDMKIRTTTIAGGRFDT